MQALAQQQIVAAPVKVKNSQQQVIDSLHQQCQQNDSLVMLHGGDGSGKSTIAELFLEQASNYAECAFVTVNERTSNDRLRAQILNQLFGTISLNDETLSRQIQRQPPLHHAVIVIDNGEQLSEVFLAECVTAVNQLSAIGQKVSVVIVAESRWAYQQKPAPHLNLQGPMMLEVQPLSKDEQVRFIQALLPDRLKRLWNLDRIQQFLNSINGYPGEIQQRLQLALATQAQRYKDEPTETAETPAATDAAETARGSAATKPRGINIYYLLFAALLITFAVAGYFNRGLIMDWWQSQNTSTPQPATPEAGANGDQNTQTVTNDAAATTTSSAKQAAVVTEQPTELPEFEPLNQQSLELMPEDLAISYRDALNDLNRVAASENDPRELEVGLIKESKVTVPQPQTEQPYNTAEIAVRDSTHYGLQIAIISTKQLLAEFRQDYALTDTTDVYQRDDGRYVISYGNFTSLEQARAAVNELPQPVQQLEPWAKSFAAMQAEIKPPQQQ